MRRGVARLLQRPHGAIADRGQLGHGQASLAAQRRRAAVVLGEQGHHLVAAVAGPLLEKGADLVVLARAHRLGQHPVGHVAHQHVLESELALPRATRFALGREDVLRPAGTEGYGRDPGPRPAPAAPASPSRTSSPPRPPAAPAAARRAPARRGGRRGPPGRCRAARPRAQGPPRRSGTPSPRRKGGSRPSAPPRRAARSRPRAAASPRAAGVSAALSGSSTSCLALLWPAAPVGAPVEQLVAGEADQQQRGAHPLGEVLDRLEHAVVGPVDVLEGEHERLAARPSLDAEAQGREEALAQASRVLPHGHQLRGNLEPDQPAQQGGGAHALLAEAAVVVSAVVAHDVAGVSQQLAPRLLRGVGVDDLAAGTNHLAESPEDDSAAVGQAAPGVERRSVGASGETALQLAQDAGLAQSGLADQGDEVRHALGLHAIEARLQLRQLLLAAHQLGLPRRGDPAHGDIGGHATGLPGGHGLGLALEGEWEQALVVHRTAGGPHRALADRHAVGTRRALQAGRHVHGVADHGVGLAHGPGEHLTRVHAHPQVEVHPFGKVLVDLVHGLLHGQAGPDRALRIVLVRHRRAEDGHHVVADVLVHGAAVALDLAAEAHQRTVHQGLHRLGIHALRHRRVARQIGEYDRDLAPLLGESLARAGRSAEELAPAVHAEVGLGRRDCAAALAAALELGSAAHAKTGARRILRAAGRAGHDVRLVRPRGWLM